MFAQSLKDPLVRLQVPVDTHAENGRRDFSVENVCEIGDFADSRFHRAAGAARELLGQPECLGVAIDGNDRDPKSRRQNGGGRACPRTDLDEERVGMRAAGDRVSQPGKHPLALGSEWPGPPTHGEMQGMLERSVGKVVDAVVLAGLQLEPSVDNLVAQVRPDLSSPIGEAQPGVDQIQRSQCPPTTGEGFVSSTSRSANLSPASSTR
jgi:hypothetical protein